MKSRFQHVRCFHRLCLQAVQDSLVWGTVGAIVLLLGLIFMDSWVIALPFVVWGLWSIFPYHLFSPLLELLVVYWLAWVVFTFFFKSIPHVQNDFQRTFRRLAQISQVAAHDAKEKTHAK